VQRGHAEKRFSILMKSMTYETLKQILGDRKRVFQGRSNYPDFLCFFENIVLSDIWPFFCIHTKELDKYSLE
jgi:hypothetical protein